MLVFLGAISARTSCRQKRVTTTARRSARVARLAPLDTGGRGNDSSAVPARPPIAILGAGLAGLAAAIRLKRGYRLFEAARAPGGLCDTIEDSGYRFDRTGHLLHLSRPAVRRFVRELMGDRLVHIDRRARIFSHGVYTHYPFQANTFGLPAEVAAECLLGFAEAYAARGGERARAETFERFILENFGAGIARHFMIPYNEKLWGLHPREITSAWCDRFVPTPGLAEVVRGALVAPLDRLGYNASFLYPKGGIGELPARMAARVDVELGARATAIDWRNRRVRVRGAWVPYRACIVSAPLDKAIGLLVDPPARVARARTGMRCAGLRYLDVALERRPGIDHHWSYVPERRLPFYRVGAYSEFSPAMAPRGKGCLYVELASRRPIRLDAVMPGVIAGLAEMGIVRGASDIRFARPRFIPRAYVVYDAAHAAAVATAIPWLEEHGIFPVGRYGRWEYAAMEDAIAQGFEAADMVCKYK
jgi:protoporphyrinogen oxidase